MKRKILTVFLVPLAAIGAIAFVIADSVAFGWKWMESFIDGIDWSK